MKTIKLSEEEIKRIMESLEIAARFYGLARIDAIKLGRMKDYATFATNKSEALFSLKAMQRAVKQDV